MLGSPRRAGRISDRRPSRRGLSRSAATGTATRPPTEHGASVIKREHSEVEKQACKEAVAFCRKALPQSDESQALRRASVSMVTDAERRFTNVYLQLFQDHELRRHNAESASSANTALFRFIDQHLATATGVRLGPVENMHNSALVGLLAGGLLGNSAKEDDEKQDFLSKVHGSKPGRPPAV